MRKKKCLKTRILINMSSIYQIAIQIWKKLKRKKFHLFRITELNTFLLLSFKRKYFDCITFTYHFLITFFMKINDVWYTISNTYIYTHTCCLISIINFSQRFYKILSIIYSHHQFIPSSKIQINICEDINQWQSIIDDNYHDQTSHTTIFSALVSRALL